MHFPDFKFRLQRLIEFMKRQLAKISGRYYVEDHIRVYPEDELSEARNNYINHRKFYLFAAQFAHQKKVADIGCGSGYGCELLKSTGNAREVAGCDASNEAISYSINNYSHIGDFTVQSITALSQYPSDHFDLVVSSEVLEHIKEYNKEDRALDELHRILKPGGVLVVGTPNSEMLSDHGFSYDEMNFLLGRRFKHYTIFENALVPSGVSREKWLSRKDRSSTGVIITQEINPNEIVSDRQNIEIKQGIKAGEFLLNGMKINTTLLHNTHSWIVVAIKS